MDLMIELAKVFLQLYTKACMIKLHAPLPSKSLISKHSKNKLEEPCYSNKYKYSKNLITQIFSNLNKYIRLLIIATLSPNFVKKEIYQDYLSIKINSPKIRL